jgi:hypothetical protein
MEITTEIKREKEFRPSLQRQGGNVRTKKDAFPWSHCFFKKTTLFS